MKRKTGYCSKCGIELDEEDTFCRECGSIQKVNERYFEDCTDQTQFSYPLPHQSSMNKIKKRSIIIIMIVVLSIISVSIFAYLEKINRNENNNDDEKSNVETLPLMISNRMDDRYIDVELYISNEFKGIISLEPLEDKPMVEEVELIRGSKIIQVCVRNNKDLNSTIILNRHSSCVGLAFLISEDSIHVVEVYPDGDYTVGIVNLMDREISIKVELDNKINRFDLGSKETRVLYKRYSFGDRIHIYNHNQDKWYEIGDYDTVFFGVYDDGFLQLEKNLELPDITVLMVFIS